MAKRKDVSSQVAAQEKAMDRDLVTFSANIDRIFKTAPDGSSRGLNVIGNIRELEKKPVAKTVYLTLVTMAIKSKIEGYTDKNGKHHESGGAVMHFKLAEELEGVSLDGQKPLDVCDDLVAAKLIRGGRTKEKHYRMWFVADLMDAPAGKTSKTTEPSGVGTAVNALLDLFKPKG